MKGIRSTRSPYGDIEYVIFSQNNIPALVEWCPEIRYDERSDKYILVDVMDTTILEDGDYIVKPRDGEYDVLSREDFDDLVGKG